MKKLSIILAVFLVLILFASPGALYARTRVYIGGYFGFPYYGYPYWYNPYPYYYYPPTYTYPSYPYVYTPPTVYSVPEQPQYWYYCQGPQGYYPYVKSCPGGWMQVVPTPPQQK